MRALLFVLVVSIINSSALCQAPSGKYEVGTVIAVTHHDNGRQASDQPQYDVSIRVRNKMYVVLYTPPNGARSVEYTFGITLMVMVGNDTLTISNKLSGTTEAPILRTETLAHGPNIDWSKAHSQYFSLTMQHLSEGLNLTEEQQTKLKRIVEQESGEAGQVLFTPVVSRKERLASWWKIVRSSGAKMKPFLSQPQWQKLQALREQQKQELKKLIAKQYSTT